MCAGLCATEEIKIAASKAKTEVLQLKCNRIKFFKNSQFEDEEKKKLTVLELTVDVVTLVALRN